MKSFARIAAATVLVLGAGTVSAFAACNGDTGSETALGAVSGAAVGGLASHSIAGAAIGGVAGGLIGNAIGSSNNREDCRRDAYYGERDRYAYDRYAYNDPPRTYRYYDSTRYYDPPPTVTYYNDRPVRYVDRYGDVHYYDDDFP